MAYDRTLKQEIWAQIRDQFLHVLMCVGSVWGIAVLFFLALYWTPVGTLLWLETLMGVCLTSLWNALRERSQWPSSRPWDPPLDWNFIVIGMLVGATTWIKYSPWAIDWVIQLLSGSSVSA